MAKHPVAVLFALAVLMSVTTAGQGPTDVSPVAFDVVSIRPSAKDGNSIDLNFTPSGLYTTRNMTVRTLISHAYGYGLTVIGAPDWLDRTRFDITAKTEIPKPTMQERQLLKSLLADRFKFAAHTETREMPVYLLVKARADGEIGPLLRRARGCDKTAPINVPRAGPVRPDQLPTCSSMYGPTRQSVGSMPLRAMIINLPRPFIDRPVLDRTRPEAGTWPRASGSARHRSRRNADAG
jgi:uncharacterized protein (TIGR03435 family)